MDTLAPAPHPLALQAQNLSLDAQEREDVAQASQVLGRRWSWLRFPARLERQFLQDAVEARLHYVLVSGVLSLIVFDGFLLADYLMAPDVFELAVKVRLGVFSPIAVLVLAVGWRHRAWMVRVLPPITIELIVLASGLFAAACVSYILAASRSPTSQYYHVGLMVVVMYGNMVQRLRLAAALKRHLRKPGDLVARLGGEEFIAVLNETSLPLAQATAERVREQILQLGLPHAASPSLPQVTVSIGVACARPAETDATPMSLIEAVDKALYDAKYAGRNRVVAAPRRH